MIRPPSMGGTAVSVRWGERDRAPNVGIAATAANRILLGLRSTLHFGEARPVAYRRNAYCALTRNCACSSAHRSSGRTAL